MREIEMDELRSQLDSVLGAVEGGERVRVLRRGHPIADFVPVEPAGLERTVTAARITAGRRPLPRNPPPPIETGRPASELILAEREVDR